MALPLLESMVPAATALAQTAAQGPDAARRHLRSRTARRWTSGRRRPKAPASSCPKSCSRSKPFRDRINIISDLSHPQAYGGGSATANHTRSAATFLSGAHAEAGPQAHLGITMDQFAAQHIGQDTPLPSLELTIEDVELELRRRPQLRLPQHDLLAERRPRRCRCRTTRRSCSSGCSATAAPTPSGAARRAAVAEPARFGAGRGRRRCSSKLPAGDRNRARSVPRRRPRDRAPHPEGRRSRLSADLDAAGRADRRAEGRRRAHQADVRPAGAGLAGRHHPRHDAAARARN